MNEILTLLILVVFNFAAFKNKLSYYYDTFLTHIIYITQKHLYPNNMLLTQNI